MQKNYPITTILAIGLLVSACNQAPATPRDSNPDTATAARSSSPAADEALVKVNNETITKALFSQFFAQRQQIRSNNDVSPEQQVKALNELANYMLIAEDAERRSLDKATNVQAALQLQRIKLLAQVAIQDRLEGKLPNDEELKKLYDERFANDTSKEYKARHILLKTEDEAKTVIVELDEGADFAELAKTKSTGPSGPSGGDLGWFEATKMVKPFSETLTTMQDGSYTKTPVQTQFGWHVILLEQSRELPPPSFEEAKKTLAAEIQQQTLQEYVQEIRKTAKVEYVGKKADTPATP